MLHLHVGEGDSGASEREADAEEVASIDAMEEGALSRAIDEVRQLEGAKAEIHRVLPADRAGYCKVYPVSVFSHERIATDYGPGKYRVRFKGPGDKYIKGGGTFDIAEGLQPATAAQAGAGGIQDFLALVKSEREKDKEDREKSKDAWFKWATLLAPLVAPKILDMIGGGGKGMTLPDLVRAMKDMKDLQGPSQDLNTQFTQVVQILQGAKELVGDDGGGKAATGSTWVDLLRDFLQSPAMGALAQAIPGLAGGGAPAPACAQPPVPRLAAENPGTPAAAQAGPNVIEQLRWLRGTLAQLQDKAAKGANARLYAELMLDNLPPAIPAAELLERLSKETWLAELASIDPRVKAHAEWFTKFRDSAVRMLTREVRKQNTPTPAAQGSDVNQPRPDLEEGQGS